jgi:hypothetical protein
MTSEPDALDRESLDFDGVDLKIDLGAIDFDLGESPELDTDLNSLDGLLNFNLDGIGTDSEAANFRSPINARGGVLAGGPQKCGAVTRKGTLCRARGLPGKKRCKFHGGFSTGPKTVEGRERIAAAQRQRWAKRGGANA